MALERAFSLDFLLAVFVRRRSGDGDKIHGDGVGIGMVIPMQLSTLRHLMLLYYCHSTNSAQALNGTQSTGKIIQWTSSLPDSPMKGNCSTFYASSYHTHYMLTC